MCGIGGLLRLEQGNSRFFAAAGVAQFVTRSAAEAVSVWGKKELLSPALAERTNKPPSKSAKVWPRRLKVYRYSKRCRSIMYTRCTWGTTYRSRLRDSLQRCINDSGKKTLASPFSEVPRAASGKLVAISHGEPRAEGDALSASRLGHFPGCGA